MSGRVEIEIMKLDEGAILPTYGSAQAAGADLYACIPDDSIEVPPNGTRMIGTGIAISLPDGYFGGVYARSGLSSEEGLRPANCVGVVDADYTGEVIVALHNDSRVYRKIKHGQRIAQLVVQPYVTADWKEVSSLDETERGTGGFGSTGREL